MRHTLLAATFLVLLVLGFAQTAAAQAIRIDRPSDGGTVAATMEVAGVATAGRTIEVYVGDTKVGDTIAEPDGWYVVTVQRPPGSAATSKIAVHELSETGARTSTASVSVTWSDVPTVAAVPPKPDSGGDAPATDTETSVAADPASEPGPDGAEQQEPDNLRTTDRPARIVVEFLVGVAGGSIGALTGLLIGSAIGDRGSSGRAAALALLGGGGGGMGAATGVYFTGRALGGNGKFLWTTIGGLSGGFIMVITGLATRGRLGGWWLPVGLAAFSMPVVGFELTSEPPQATVGVSPDGTPTLGMTFRW